MVQFQLTQLWKGGGQAQLLAITGVDTAHERLNQLLVDFTAQSARHKVGDTFITVGRCRWDCGFLRQSSLTRR